MDAHAAVDTLRQQGIHTLLVQFTDVHGVPKGKWLPLERLQDALAQGAGFAGPSIAGTGLPRTGPRSEFYARGDAATLLPLPWAPGFARLIGDGFVAGQPFDACPRQVLRRALARLAERGWSLRVGIEPEFFLLRRAGDGSLVPADDHDRLSKPSYDLKALPRQQAVLLTLAQHLAACGLAIEQTDHEDAHGQYELNFGAADALTSCDNLLLFKQAAHALAEREGLVFSMMPKPFADQPGSGLHMHVSLWQAGGSALCSAAPQFMAGVLAHSAALTALAAPTVNSYKRLTVGESLSGTTWAPAYAAHGPNNRTALVRTLPGRFEWRLPDAACNPYLALAGLIAAGLDGVDRALSAPAPVTDDLFALPLATIRARGIPLLPQTLGEACDALQADAVLTTTLGDTLSREFLALKRDEALAYARHVSLWEYRRYGCMY